MLLSHSPPGNFAEKRVLKLLASFSSHCLAYELNLTRRLFKGRVVHSVQLQMQIENIIFKSWGMHRKHEMVSWFQSNTAAVTNFAFPSLFAFIATLFFFQWTLLLLASFGWGNFGKAFNSRIAGSDRLVGT